MKTLRTVLSVLLAIAPIGLAAQQSRTQVTVGVSPDSNPMADHYEHTQLATQFANATMIFPTSNGMTQHQLTWNAGASVTGLTVTFSGSTSGANYTTIGTSSLLSGTLTGAGTYNLIKVAYTAYAGSGSVDADYYGLSSLVASPANTSEVDIKTINGVVPTQTTGGGLSVTIVSGTLVNDYAGTQGMTVIASGSTSAMTAATTNVPSIECNNVSAAGANTVTIMDGNGRYYLGPNFSIPASSNIVLNWTGFARFTSGINISAGAANAVQCEVSPGSKQ